MAYTARFDARSKKIVVEIDADDASFAAAPLSKGGAGENKLIASAGHRVTVSVPNQPPVTVAVNGWFKPAPAKG